MRALAALFGLSALGGAFHVRQDKTCSILDSYPYSKTVDMATIPRDNTNKIMQEKNKLVLMIELSRFLNRKAPILLQEFATSKKIFETKKKISMVENEAILRQKIMQQMNSRSKRSPQGFSGTALLQDQAKEDEIPM